MDENYPKDWARVTLMVSPDGEYHAIGGDRESGDGDTPYIAMDRLQTRLSLSVMASKLLDLLDRIEVQDDVSLAGQRHEIARQQGFTVEFGEPNSGDSH